MRVWLLLVMTALLCGVLAYRVFALEARVERLSRAADAAPPEGAVVDPPSGPAAGETTTAVEAVAEAEHARRLGDLETNLAGLRKEVDALSSEARQKADRADLDRSASADRILGLVTQEAMRVRDRQVEFHRDRWIEMRERAVEEFVTRHGLDATQANTIRKLLLDEVDQMVAVFKAHSAEDDPKEADQEWMNMLRDTDRAAKRVLDPAQTAAWDLGRAYERRVFMPWLPQ